MNPKRLTVPSLTARLLRAGAAGLATVVAGAAMSTGCLDRPVAPQEPNTTNIVVEKILQEKVDKIDLLFMIDNSISMADKQAILAAAVPQLVRRLVDPAVIAGEFPPVTDIHIGVISSSLGSYGGTVCGPDPAPPQNDRAHLIPTVRDSVNSHQGLGFLWWDPESKYGGQTNVDALIADFETHVKETGEFGCGFEASLESWYRFLIDPEPHMNVISNTTDFVQTLEGLDQGLLDQRKEFLRPDSLVAIIMLSDENDCSFVTEQGFIGAYGAVTNVGHTLARGTSQCAQDPNNPCCRSCATSDPNCPATDAQCELPADPLLDKVNLRCWNQKQRFGIDFLYPTMRYVNALKSQTICKDRWDLDPNACQETGLVQNPLYMDLTGSGKAGARPQSLVFLAGIVGVPWQDIATADTVDDPNALRYMTSAELLQANRWDWITGSSMSPPKDPLMVESPEPRTGTHPLNPAWNPQPVSSPEGANPVNGHEWNAHNTTRGDLQFACIFPLVPNKQCEPPSGTGCDCKAADVAPDQSPLCQQGANYTTLQTYAKGYPGLRQLQVLKDYGENSIVASICPKITQSGHPDYGYNPAVSAIIDRLKEALGGKCLGRTIALADVAGTPDDPSDDIVPCKVLEARYVQGSGGACACNAGEGRISLADLEGGGDLDKAVKAQLLKDKHCDNKLTMCADYCVCLINEYQEPNKTQCLNDPAFQATNGWCYVDPLDPPIGQKIGNPEIVEGCDPSQKRLLRFEPEAGAIAYIACLGAPYSGEGAE
jgi:hypothetical protein